MCASTHVDAPVLKWRCQLSIHPPQAIAFDRRPRLIQDASLPNFLQAFARDELLPHAAKWDAEKHFPVDTLHRAAELGFAGIYVHEDVGGSGLTRGDAAVIFEALAYGDVSTTAYLTIHNMVRVWRA